MGSRLRGLGLVAVGLLVGVAPLLVAQQPVAAADDAVGQITFSSRDGPHVTCIGHLGADHENPGPSGKPELVVVAWSESAPSNAGNGHTDCEDDVSYDLYVTFLTTDGRREVDSTESGFGDWVGVASDIHVTATISYANCIPKGPVTCSLSLAIAPK